MPEPEAAVIDAPQADAPATREPFSTEFHPLAEVPPALKDLAKRFLPVDEDNEPVAEPDPDAPPVEEKPKKVEKPKALADPSLRLAPDLAPKKAEDAPPADDIQEIPEEIVEQGKTPKAKADLKKFREAHNAMALELRQLREKVKTAVPAEDPALTAMVEQLKAEREELSQKLERKGLELHPKFQEQFVKPIEGMMGQAVEIVKEADGDTAALERALSLPPGKTRTAALDDILGEVQSPTLRDRLGRLVDAIDTKTRQRDSVLRDHKGALSKLTQAEKIAEHERLVQHEKQMNGLLDGAERNLEENIGLEVLKKTGDPEYKWWDDQVDDIKKNARRALFEATPEEMAHLAYLGMCAGPYRQMFLAERKARLAAEQRSKSVEDAEPTFGGKPKQAPAAGDDGEFSADEDITKVALTKLRRGDYGR